MLPGKHFTYSPIPKLVTRLGYAANIGRPSIGQLIPTTTVNYENRTVSSVPPVPGPNERKRLNGKPFDQHAPQDQASEAGEANLPGWVPGESVPRPPSPGAGG